VVLPPSLDVPWLEQVRDSKLLTPKTRCYLSQGIHQAALGVGIGIVPPRLIDAQGIAKATRLAMKLAVEKISPLPESLLIDYFRLPEVALPQKGVTGGDGRCFSIACASIVAKVARDSLMVQLSRVYPGYGLARNKGYGTEEHIASLYSLGPSPIHRHSFQPVKGMLIR
jgi:ribonuclease HII